MDKKIVISAGLDTSEFDRKIQEITRRLNSITGKADMSGQVSSANQALKQAGYSPITGGQELQHNKNLLQSVKELDTFIQKQVQSEGKVLQALDNRIKKLNELKKINAEDLKTEKEREELKTKIAKQEESIQRLQGLGRAGASGIEEGLQRRQQQISQMSGLEKLRYGYSTGGIKGAANMFGGFGSLAGGLLSGIGTAINVMDPLAREYAGLGRNTAVSMGAAVQGSSDIANSMYGRRLSRDLIFGKERTQASEMAKKEMDSVRLWDKIGMGGTALGIAGGAIAGLGMAAGTIGTGGLLPLAMGIGTAGYAGYQALTNDRFRKRAGALVSSEFEKSLEADYQSETVQKFQQARQGLEAQQYLKKLAEERMNEQMPRNLAFQRQMGMQNNEFYGSFLNKGFNAGFTDEKMLAASQGIMSAGGTTQGSKDLALLSNQLQRNIGMTNANSILGRLSGAGQSDSKEAVVKILSEGMRVGLDTSRYAQESRKFAESVAELAYRSGARTEEGAGQIAKTLGGFTADLSTKGLEAGRSAYEQFNQKMGEGAGPQNFIKQNYLARQKEFKVFSGQEISYLSQLSPEQVMEGGAAIQSAASKAGMSVKDFQNKLLKSTIVASTLTADQEKKLESFTSKYGSAEGAKKFQEKVKSKKFADKDYISLVAGQHATGAQIGQSGSMTEEGGLLGVAALGRTEADTKEVKKLMGKTSTRIEDDKERAEAKQAKTVNEAMVTMFSEMSSAFSKINEATSEQMKNLLNASEKMKTEGKDAIEEYNKAFTALNNTIKEGSGVLQRKTGLEGFLEGLPIVGQPQK